MSAHILFPTVGAQSAYAAALYRGRQVRDVSTPLDFRTFVQDEIERLIALLDAADDDCDIEDEGHNEPSLGFVSIATGYPAEFARVATDDREAEDEHDEEDGTTEPSLAHPERQPFLHRKHWSGDLLDIFGADQSGRAYGYLGCRNDREDEHDGREPDESGYGDFEGLSVEEHGEPSLGWNDVGDPGDVFDGAEGEPEDDLGATVFQSELQLAWGAGQFGKAGANA